jgi:hypothetical protein
MEGRDPSGERQVSQGGSVSLVKANTYQDATGGSNAVFSGVASPPNGMGFRNRILNGGMVIDQRNAGASVTANSVGAYCLDRYQLNFSQNSKFTVQQNAGAVTPPSGFTNYLGITSSSAYSVLTGDYFLFEQPIEGFNTADLGWGTAGAQTVTLSFWVRSSLTGTFGGVLANSAQNRSYPFTYAISASNTWEQKTVTVAGDTSGTWVTNNGLGIRVRFGLGAGSTFSGTAGAWAGSNFFSATGATSVVGTNGATFYITGVQLEAGTVASPFERRDYGRELIMCQRYYQQWGGNTNFERIGNAYCHSTTQARADIVLVVTMRSTPTLTVSAFNNWAVEVSGSAPVCNNITLDQASPRIASTNFDVASGLTAGQGCHIRADNSANARFNLSAEL